MNMTEAKSGEVEIDDIEAEAVETMLYFLYNEKIKDNELINTKLLFAADKYNIASLVKICNQHLKMNLSQENALDVLLCADKLNQKDLLEAATELVRKNVGNIVKTNAWNETMKINPTFIVNLFSNIVFLN